MSSQPLVEIICDGNIDIGFGHIRRSLTLASHLRTEGMEVRVTGHSDEASPWIPASQPLNRVADILVLDCPSGIELEIVKAKHRYQTTVALDWFGDVSPDANVIIYPHSARPIEELVFVGFDYVIVRNEVLKYRDIARPKAGNKVLVVLGGGDLLGQARKSADLLSSIGFDVVLVQGPLVRDTTTSSAYPTYFYPDNFSSLLAESDWVVTNSGGCMFEAMCIGVPTLLMPQTPDETEIARLMVERGATLGIGVDQDYEQFLGRLSEIAERGRELIDGAGVSRISSILGELL